MQLGFSLYSFIGHCGKESGGRVLRDRDLPPDRNFFVSVFSDFSVDPKPFSFLSVDFVSIFSTLVSPSVPFVALITPLRGAKG
jgi:hypothetical protein